MTFHNVKITRSTLEALWLDRSKTVEAVGKELGLGPCAVRRRAQQYGFEPRRSGLPAPKITDSDLFRELWSAGVSVEQIGGHFKVSVRAVYLHAKRLDMPKRNRPNRLRTDIKDFFVNRAFAADARKARAYWQISEMVDRPKSGGPPQRLQHLGDQISRVT